MTFRRHGRHAASKRRAPRRVRRADRLDPYDEQTLLIFDAMNHPSVAYVRAMVGTTYQRTRNIKAALIMARYLGQMAGAR